MGATPTLAAHDQTPLPTTEYDRVLAVVDDCRAATTLDDFKHTLMNALHDHFGFPNTTFLSGPTFHSAFYDPAAVTTGRTSAHIDEYAAKWYTTDVFATASAVAAFRRSPAISHTDLTGVPTSAVHYVEQFLYRHRMRSAAAMHLQLAHGCHAMVGIFDFEGREVQPVHLAALRRLAPELSAIAQTLPGSPRPGWRDRLTPRQRELAELLADGYTNDEIATVLSLGPDTVKKYVSRILALTRVRNRAEFVKLVCTETAVPARA
ncbi:helix-turn-helix transcriptional regulator [Gordonia sp. NPDC003424]